MALPPTRHTVTPLLLALQPASGTGKCSRARRSTKYRQRSSRERACRPGKPLQNACARRGGTHRPHAQRLPLLVVASAEARGAQLRKRPNRRLALVRRHGHRAACIVKLHQWGDGRCAARQDCDLAHHTSCQCVESFCQCRGGARQGQGQACVASLAQLRVDGQRVPAEASRDRCCLRETAQQRTTARCRTR